MTQYKALELREFKEQIALEIDKNISFGPQVKDSYHHDDFFRL